MPADTSPKSPKQPSRYERTKAQMMATLPLSPDGSAGEQETGRARPERREPEQRQRAPKRHNDRIDKVLAAIAGEQPEADADKKRVEARATEDAGREAAHAERGGRDERTANPPPAERESKRPAFEDDDDGDDAEAERKPRSIKTKSLTEFAEAVEVEPKAIYGLEVPLDEGEQPMTIGALKDHYKATRDLADQRIEFEDYREQVQSEIIRGRNELDGVLERVAAVLPRKDLELILETVREQAIETKARAAKELREYFPEWDDDDKRKTAGEKMRGWLRSYGIPGQALDNIYDAKIVRMLWQMGNKAERYMQLRAGAREKKPSVEPRASRRRPPPTPTETARAAVAKGDKVGAVAALLLGEANGHDQSRFR